MSRHSARWPLTPAHLLYGRKITALPHTRAEQDEILDPDYIQNGNAEIQKESKRLDFLLQHFCTRWRQKYLMSLREFHKTTGNNNAVVKVGDVVLVHDEGSRINWKLAVVEELLPRKDGHVRAVPKGAQPTAQFPNSTLWKYQPNLNGVSPHQFQGVTAKWTHTPRGSRVLLPQEQCNEFQSSQETSCRASRGFSS